VHVTAAFPRQVNNHPVGYIEIHAFLRRRTELFPGFVRKDESPTLMR
jgi:hypothetical protein